MVVSDTVSVVSVWPEVDVEMSEGSVLIGVRVVVFPVEACVGVI